MAPCLLQASEGLACRIKLAQKDESEERKDAKADSVISNHPAL